MEWGKRGVLVLLGGEAAVGDGGRWERISVCKVERGFPRAEM